MNNTIYRTSLTLAALFVFSVGLHAQGKAKVDPWAPGENIYAHYTGTIGTHKAVIDLRYGYQGASNFGGSSCYFTDEGGLNFFLITQPPTFSHDETFRAQVFPENVKLSDIKNVYSIFAQTRRFELKLHNDSLTGNCINPGEIKTLDINLKEDYSNAVHFIFKHIDDTAIVIGKKNDTIRAIVLYVGIGIPPEMKKKDAAFINNAVARFMSSPKISVKDTHDLPEACIQRFFTECKTSVKEGKELGGGNFTGRYFLFPVYNDDGFLVLQEGGYQYDFENKEYSDRNLYLCLDVKNKKTLKPDNILDLNNPALPALLENAFRKKYELDPGKKLSDLFTADKMPLTDNIMIVNKGIIFSYSPAKIFRDDQDISGLQEMRIFLSYDELGSILTPEFKARIGLK